jgi:uncharacterized membrane-anchored protein YhcB (DUF1043 family)
MPNTLLFLFIGLIAGSLHGFIWMRTQSHNHRELKRNFLNLRQEHEEIRKALQDEQQKCAQAREALAEFYLSLKQAKQIIDQNEVVQGHIADSEELHTIHKSLKQKVQQHEADYT